MSDLNGRGAPDDAFLSCTTGANEEPRPCRNPDHMLDMLSKRLDFHFWAWFGKR